MSMSPQDIQQLLAEIQRIKMGGMGPNAPMPQIQPQEAVIPEQEPPDAGPLPPPVDAQPMPPQAGPPPMVGPQQAPPHVATPDDVQMSQLQAMLNQQNQPQQQPKPGLLNTWLRPMAQGLAYGKDTPMILAQQHQQAAQDSQNKTQNLISQIQMIQQRQAGAATAQHQAVEDERARAQDALAQAKDAREQQTFNAQLPVVQQTAAKAIQDQKELDAGYAPWLQQNNLPDTLLNKNRYESEVTAAKQIPKYESGPTGPFSSTTGQPAPGSSGTRPADYEPKAGTVNGKPTTGYFDKNSRKVMDGNGNDISSTFQLLPDVDQQALQSFLQKNPGKGADDWVKAKAGFAPAATFNMNNPQASPEDVAYWVKQVQKDAKNYTLIQSPALKQQVNQGLAKAGVDVNQLDAGIRDTAQLAGAALKHVANIEPTITQLDKEGKLGPIAGRWGEFRAGKVGAGDPEYSALRTNILLLDTALSRIHGGSRGGASPQMLEHMKSLLNAGTMDAATLKSNINVVKEWLQGYADLGEAGGGSDNAAPAVGPVIQWGRDAQGNPTPLK